MIKSNSLEIDFDHILYDRLFTEDKYQGKEEIILSCCEKNIGSLGNFSVITGLPKSGKSSVISSVMASCMSGANYLNFKVNQIQDCPFFALFDTESAKYDFRANVYRAKNISGIEKIPSNVNFFSLRKDRYEMIRQLVEHYLKTYPTSLIIIDSFLDIVGNFNDEKQSIDAIFWLKRMTDIYNVFILGVVHTGKKEGFTLGHFGSMVDRYAQSVIEVKKDIDKQEYIVIPKLLRSAKDFNTYKFIKTDDNNVFLA